jgi:two-component sensor histidine kinase
VSRAATERFASLPTAAKLLLILTAALLPIGLALIWIAQAGIREANQALRERAQEQARGTASALQSHIARNALALRIAANGALAGNPSESCARAQRSLAVAPAVAQRFELDRADGTRLCTAGDIGEFEVMPLVAPGDIQLRVAPDKNSLVLRVGVIGGMATASLAASELRAAAIERTEHVDSLIIGDGARELPLIDDGKPTRDDQELALSRWPLANDQIEAMIGTRVTRITTLDRLLLTLPLVMWVMAALISWLLVTRLLIRPLRQLERAVAHLQPGDSAAALPRKLGPATEIQELRDAFARSLERIEQSEQEMSSALEGQRRLVREVHHRVKNNLQVIASLLNIHGRTAESVEARAAYAAIGRRVSALSIVHRNHFAEMEENRGISLRPLLSELSAELRAGAPDPARGLAIDLDLETVYTTQDVAVSVAFLITEIVEFAMLHRPQDPVEVSVRRTSELTARLTLGSPVLVPDEADEPEKMQFERIIAGLAKQLRSPMERKLGRYSVDLPAFPPN